MSLDLLGDGFDLHGGGQDLAFPHHENERAQAVADGRTFARHWVHNGWVEVEGTKMSKSLGNFTSLTDMLERSDARAYRLLVLRAHFRSPIEVTTQTVADAEKGLDRLDTLARRFGIADLLAASGRGYVVEATDAGDADAAALASFSARMDDDLDTPGALAGVFELASAAHSAADAGNQDEGARLARTAAVLAAALGVPLRGGSGEVDEAASRPRLPTRRGTPGQGLRPGGHLCATNSWRWAGRSRTRRRAPPSAADGHGHPPLTGTASVADRRGRLQSVDGRAGHEGGEGRPGANGLNGRSRAGGLGREPARSVIVPGRRPIRGLLPLSRLLQSNLEWTRDARSLETDRQRSNPSPAGVAGMVPGGR